jgi:O-antigen/teichoic acid export membrane protein
LLYNLLVLTQVYLQSQVRFGQVALGNSLPGTIFVILLAALVITHHAVVHNLLAAYLASWAVTVTVLLVQAFRSPQKPPAGDVGTSTQHACVVPTSVAQLGLTYIAAGWPIVLANTGFGLMQSADRVTVNLTRPIHDFAIYSLSQSTIYVPITILAAISRVAFTYFAGTTHADRAEVYRSSTRSIALIWMLLLPYYFGVEFVVTRFLPRYVLGLAAGRILLLSVLFLSLIQIVQLNTFSLQGRQRQFLAGSIVAVGVAFATAWIGSRVIGTLAAVAWSQVITAMLWWLGNEFFLRSRTETRGQDILRVLLSFAIGALALTLAPRIDNRMAASSAIYLLIALPAAALLFRSETALLLKYLRHSPEPLA